MFTKLLHKIINTRVGKTNYWLATIGMAFSILLILAAIALRQNFKQLKGNKSQYLVINKLVTNDIMVDPNKGTFTKENIEELRATGFFDSIQGIKTSLYKVKLNIPMNTIPLNTDMFFQSVPDAYLDAMPKDWTWKPGDNTLKGIAPRFLVDMYNYGFAVGQQLPQLSESTIGMIPLDFTISNRDGSKQIFFKGNIGGLSSRYFSILVPESFMNWANENFGFIEEKPATGVVAKAKDPTSVEMNDFLRNKGMKTDYGAGRYSQYGFLIKILEKATTSIGVLFFLFALLVFLMFIQLTITNAKQEIHLLKTLGTSPNQLQRFLMGRVMPTITYIIVGILLLLSCIQVFAHYNKDLKSREIDLPIILPMPVFIVAILIFALLWAINYWAVKKYVKDTL
jgi:hypothetical protein